MGRQNANPNKMKVKGRFMVDAAAFLQFGTFPPLSCELINKVYSARFRAFPPYLAFRRFKTTKACINHILRVSWYLFRDTSVTGVRPAVRYALHQRGEPPPAAAPHGGPNRTSTYLSSNLAARPPPFCNPSPPLKTPQIGPNYLAPPALRRTRNGGLSAEEGSLFCH